MTSQNDIIRKTKDLVEKNRQVIHSYKNTIKDEKIRSSFTHLENIFFEFVALCYTHTEIWSNEIFWQNYDVLGNRDFPSAAYNQMITMVLGNFYNCLYFCIEGALYEYLNENQKLSLLNLYDKAKKSLSQNSNNDFNYQEFKNGLTILKNVRNSYHGDKGCFKFRYDNESIIFKDKKYNFEKNENTKVSYQYIEDFVPILVSFFKKLP